MKEPLCHIKRIPSGTLHASERVGPPLHTTKRWKYSVHNMVVKDTVELCCCPVCPWGRPTFSSEFSEISEDFWLLAQISDPFRKDVPYGFFLSWMFVESSRSVEVLDPAFRNALRILPKIWESFRNPSENFGTLPKIRKLPKFRNPSENFRTLPKISEPFPKFRNPSEISEPFRIFGRVRNENGRY